jgi:hypothetical protein
LALLLAVFAAAHLAVAVGYWAAVDLPRARRCNAHWSAVDQLAPLLRGEPAAGAASSPCVRLLLEFTVDRRVRELPAQAADPAVRWAVIADNEPLPPGFAPRTSVGGLRLLVRR